MGSAGGAGSTTCVTSLVCQPGEVIVLQTSDPNSGTALRERDSGVAVARQYSSIF